MPGCASASRALQGTGKSGCMDKSGLFSSTCGEIIKLPEAKTTKDQTIRKRMEAAFIESMQRKPVSALPAGGKWTFEIKFDGYRCIAMKRGSEVTLFSRHEKVLNNASQELRAPSPRVTREGFNTCRGIHAT